MKQRGRVLALSTAAGAVLGLVACSSSPPSVDVSKVSTGLSESTGFSVTVTCPAEIPLTAGQTATCTTSIDGETFEVPISVVDDQGTVEYGVRQLGLESLPARIEEAAGVAVSVDCPRPIPIKAGHVTECEVTDGVDTAVAIVTQQDDQGTWNFDLLWD